MIIVYKQKVPAIRDCVVSALQSPAFSRKAMAYFGKQTP